MLNTLLFSPEEEIPAAGLTVLGVVFLGAIKRDTRYRVRMTCCGSELILTHRTITKRMHAAFQHCQRCSSKVANKHLDDDLPKIMRATAFLPGDILPAGEAWQRPASLAPGRTWRTQA
ncbi:MAG: hypothetical protein KAX46_01330 [Chromatiaceae bacterium]|nr:hypothetical protein [Chromatiaceae bacterium]